MISPDLVFFISLLYVVVLFAVAFGGDRAARRGRPGWLHSPVVYTLSISVYCSSWTFYGAVGSAARNGLEFATIYIGPTLVFVGWWLLLRKLLRIGHAQGITSIADMISSRYGKSAPLARSEERRVGKECRCRWAPYRDRDGTDGPDVRGQKNPG